MAKQEVGKAGRGMPGNAAIIGPQDTTALRETNVGYDSFSDFVLPSGSSYHQHVVYFRVPDVVQCELLEEASRLRAGTFYGLEMRLLDITGQVVAGADEGTHFDKKYLGDKVDTGGNNQPYVIHVESNENIIGSLNPLKAYRLHCRSGSGHTMGELVKKASGNLY